MIHTCRSSKERDRERMRGTAADHLELLPSPSPPSSSSFSSHFRSPSKPPILSLLFLFDPVSLIDWRFLRFFPWFPLFSPGRHYYVAVDRLQFKMVCLEPPTLILQMYVSWLVINWIWFGLWMAGDTGGSSRSGWAPSVAPHRALLQLAGRAGRCLRCRLQPLLHLSLPTGRYTFPRIFLNCLLFLWSFWGGKKVFRFGYVVTR